MPRIPVAPPKPTHFPAYLLTAAGRADDFYVLGTIPEVDERNKERDAFHPPTTYVLHYHGDTMDVVAEVPSRLDELLFVPQPHGLPQRLVGAGFPKGILEFGAAGYVEQPLPAVRGSVKSMWGTEDHLFACGGFAPFVLYRKQGAWFELTLPEGCPHLWGVTGYSERDVYFVGDDGWVLHFDGVSLVKVELETTHHLTKVAVLDDRYVCITGFGGVLFMGNRHGFRRVPTHSNEEPLNAIVSFDGAVYYPSLDGVWRFDGKAAPVCVHPQPCRWISALEDALLISAADSAWLFDGQGVQALDTYV